MDVNEIRKTFLDFFAKKSHLIVPSSPLVNHDDPSLMFINAGMNPFKDYFLGNKQPKNSRIADSQKCLRVSGKHNDLEEVGLDSYHHTLFEMLGNWSFGDYFKEEAIAWSWELLTEVFGLNPEMLYVTVFEGDASDNLNADEDAEAIWRKYIDPSRILRANKKDNFWEMGDQGPCGPCSEIHVDIRTLEEREALSGAELVNQDHPHVIEIWNLVFIEYNRKADGSLEKLPNKHIDTGMGLERLAMVLQGKKSNYETDLFVSIIQEIERISSCRYENSYHVDAKKDIAFRVIADHLRAVAFGIADGAVPSSTGAGYVLRRILRRAVRYAYSFLDYKKPLLHSLLPTLAKEMGESYPELHSQLEFISKVILEEEKSFLKTLEDGLQRLDVLLKNNTILPGRDVFELYDTFGFPIDLTQLIAHENGKKIDTTGFNDALEAQRNRSRKDSQSKMGDWHICSKKSGTSTFIGYHQTEMQKPTLLKYRSIVNKDGLQYQWVFLETPFYAESGGQVGDTGMIVYEDGSTLKVSHTIKENDLILHVCSEEPSATIPIKELIVDRLRRLDITRNHSATHLLHAALREVLGSHVVQRGSLVKDRVLRFDFSHFEKMTEEEISKVSKLVNDKIMLDIPCIEKNKISLAEAKNQGAMMLFGEKYGDKVRMITFDPDFSVELCGGCHVDRSGSIGSFIIKSEQGVAAGVRRIEAITGRYAYEYSEKILDNHRKLETIFKNPNVVEEAQKLVDALKSSNKKLEKLQGQAASQLVSGIVDNAVKRENIQFIFEKIELDEAKQLKSILFELEKKLKPAIIVLAAIVGSKAQIAMIISKELANQNDKNAGILIKKWSSLINGGGGGQAFFATAGGSNIEGLDQVILQAKDHFEI